MHKTVLNAVWLFGVMEQFEECTRVTRTVSDWNEARVGAVDRYELFM